MKTAPVIASTRLVVIIPAFNEEDAIGNVLNHIPEQFSSCVIVANNASTDGTAAVARAAGAIVVEQPKRGYGAACLRGMEEASNHAPDVVIFVDGDYSDTPEEMTRLVQPIVRGEAEMVIGSRVLGIAEGIVEQGALLPQARFGNWLSTLLIRLLWGYRFTDLGPFRAITWSALQSLQMRDRNFGWTVEMQIKAAIVGLRCTEVPVSYRKRIGKSKITGTIEGTIKAGIKILWTIARYWVAGIFSRKRNEQF